MAEEKIEYGNVTLPPSPDRIGLIKPDDGTEEVEFRLYDQASMHRFGSREPEFQLDNPFGKTPQKGAGVAFIRRPDRPGRARKWGVPPATRKGVTLVDTAKLLKNKNRAPRERSIW